LLAAIKPQRARFRAPFACGDF